MYFAEVSVSGVNAGDGDDESSPFAAEPIDSPGVVVLSEFSGCCRVLNGALHVNPYSTQSVVDALDRALGMSTQERLDRRRRISVPYMPTQKRHGSSVYSLMLLPLPRDKILSMLEQDLV